MMLVSCAAETIFTGLGGGGFATVYDAVTRTGPLRRLLRQRARAGRQAPRTRTAIEVVFVGQAMPYEIGPPHGRRARHPGRRAPPVATLGPAAVGRGGRARAAGVVWHAVPGGPRRAAAPGRAGHGGRGRGRGLRRAGRGTPAGRRPAAAPRPPQGVRAADRPTPPPSTAGEYADALRRLGGRRRRAEPRPTWSVQGGRDRAAVGGGRRLHACMPAATTSTTCCRPWPRRHRLDARRSAAPTRRRRAAWSRRCGRRTAGGDDQRRAPSTAKAMAARSPPAWAWAPASGCDGYRRAPQLHDRRGRADPRAGPPPGQPDGFDDVAAGGGGPERRPVVAGRGGRRQPDPAGTGAVRAADARR